jgi:hypothetical protein
MESLHKMYDINLKKAIGRVQAQAGGVVVLSTLSGDAGLRSSLSEVQIKDSFQRLITQGYLIKSPGRNKYQVVVAAVEDIENAPENNAQSASVSNENKEIDSSSKVVVVASKQPKVLGNGNGKKGLAIASLHESNATPLKSKAIPAGQVKCNPATPSKAQINSTPSKKSPLSGNSSRSGSGSGSGKKANKSSSSAKKAVSKSTSKSPKAKASTVIQQNTLAWHIKKYSETHFITFKNIS